MFLAGNRLTAVEGSQSTTATYDAANQLTSINGVTVTSDANGNLLSDGTTSYQYDSLDRLIAATTGITTTTMGYTAMGDRLRQATAGNVPGHIETQARPAGDDSHECRTSEVPGALAGLPAVEADPIDTRSGEFYLVEHDLGVGTGCGDGSLRFERTYSTMQTAFGALSPGWVHNYERQLRVSGSFVMAQRPRGSQMLFEDRGGDVYAGKFGSAWTLMKRVGGGWALISRDRLAEIYDADGYLIAEQDGRGNQTWMTYETVLRNGEMVKRLARVDAPGGRSLWFGYDYYRPHRLIVVGDNTGRTVQFGYSDAGLYDFAAIGRLTTVTDVMGGISSYSYAGESWLITSKADALGQPVFTNTYDADSRVSRQINNTGLDLHLSYAIITDTMTISQRLGGDATNVSALIETTSVDQNGAQVTHIYGNDGLLRQMVDPAGAVTRYRNYTSGRQPTQIVDALGQTTTFQYNDHGLPTQITNALGQTTTLSYDDWGKLTQVSDPAGHSSTLSYSNGLLTGTTNAAGETTTLTYANQAGWQQLLSQIVDTQGLTTTLTYNTAGDVVAITDAAGRSTQLTPDGAGRPTQVRSAAGITTTLIYDAADRVTQVTDGQGGTIQLTYDAVGNVTRMQDQIGATTVLTYTLGGRLTAMQDADGGISRISYDTIGRPVTMTNALGAQTVYGYDQAGYLIRVTDPSGATTQYAHDLLGQITTITTPNQAVTTITRDALGRPTLVEDAVGHRLQYGYDAVGNTIAMTDTLGMAVQLSYDALGRPLSVTDPTGVTTSRSYDPQGRLATQTDGLGRVTRYEYTALGELAAVVANVQAALPASVDTNVRTSFGYDALGRLATVTDPNNHSTSFGYDGLGRLSQLTDALNRTMHYAYDARGQLSQWQKADGTTIQYGYNARGLPISVTAPDQMITTQYNALGQPTQVQGATGTTSYQYDVTGRPTAITLPTGATVGYRYDAVGNRTATILPDGTTITTTYTLANQPASMRAWDGSTTTFGYDANGRLQTVTRPNGVTTTTGYDAAGRVTRLTHARGATVLDQLQYQYDAAGRRVRMIDATRTLTYTFDGLDRLVQATSSDGTPYQYSYDAAGNRLTALEGSHSTTASYNAANQLTSLNGVAVTSDANGNLLSDGTTSYQYDSLDRLIRATTGITTTTMGYTALGDRLWQATAGITTTYTLDLNTALAQVLAQTTNGTTTSILPGLGQQTNGAWQYWHADAQGSVQAVSDGTGQIIGTQRYSPFGRSEAQTGILAAMGYTGEPQDSLVYLRARYYHPALGRFLTPDSIVPDVLNGQDWNAYAYVRNNPVQWVDPRGHAPDGFEPHDSTGGWLGDVAHWAGEKAQQVGDWWNKKDCTCTPPQSSDWATAFSAAGTVGFGFGTEPVRTHATVTIEQFNRQHPTQPPDISKRSIPYNKLSDKGIHYDNNLYVNGDGAYISAADPNTGKRYTFGRERVLNPKGFAAGILGGMAVDAMLQGLQDWNRCLTGADRIHNMLVAALAAGAVGLVGAAVFGAVLLVLPTATLTATVASITVSVIASNIGPIADLKNRALR